VVRSVVRVLDAVIFDMDGVLIDSEPLWQAAEQARFAEVGVHLTSAEMVVTMGLRVDEVVAYWYGRRPWPDPDHEGLVRRLLDTVAELVSSSGRPLPGVAEAVALCEKQGLALAVASSSTHRIIDAVLDRLGLATQFDVVCSAETELYGKPHPGVFLSAAAQLGVDPNRCLVIEDSFNGMIAALAARMRCLVVPERWSPRFAAADHVLESLEDLPSALPKLRSESRMERPN
jgi:HAD superfamily hydrolase (TIGR01509 family)